jgi:hypothetical protein
VASRRKILEKTLGAIDSVEPLQPARTRFSGHDRGNLQELDCQTGKRVFETGEAENFTAPNRFININSGIDSKSYHTEVLLLLRY